MKTSFLGWTAVVGGAWAGCAGAPAEVPASHDDAMASATATTTSASTPAPESRASAMPLDPAAYLQLPQVRSIADARAHAGERVAIHGRLEISRTRSVEQPVSIAFADGARLRCRDDATEGDQLLRDVDVVVVGTVRDGGVTVETVQKASP